MNQEFLPTSSISNLKKRAELLNRVRLFFEQRDFIHVETPILSHDIVVDRYLHPVSIKKHFVAPGVDAKDELFLQTSPEFGMKRLLAAGAEAIYQIGKVFRASESGPRHNPEFTMLEWYRVGDDLQSGMQLLAEFASFVLGREPIKLSSYAEIFEATVGVNPHDASTTQLAGIAEQAGLDAASLSENESNHDEWLNLLLTHVIEPTLGFDHPVIIYDWPASQSALAIVRNGDPPLAERFELFANGVELANGYNELLDPSELIARNRKINAKRSEDGSRELPEESRLLDAMRAGLPACAGVAVGIDRLAMVALGTDSIDDVISFPIRRA